MEIHLPVVLIWNQILLLFENYILTYLLIKVNIIQRVLSFMFVVRTENTLCILVTFMKKKNSGAKDVFEIYYAHTTAIMILESPKFIGVYDCLATAIEFYNSIQQLSKHSMLVNWKLSHLYFSLKIKLTICKAVDEES